MPLEDLVFVLEPPKIRPGDQNQYRDVWLASEDRHERLCRFLCDDETVPALAPCEEALGPEVLVAGNLADDAHSNKRRWAQAFESDDDAMTVIPDAQRVRVDLRLVETSESSTPPMAVPLAEPCSSGLHDGNKKLTTGRRIVSLPKSMGGRAARKMNAAHRMPVADFPPLPPTVDELKERILQKEQRSVQTVPARRDNVTRNLFYTLCLQVAPGDDRILKGFSLTPYRMAVDTAESCFWFYGEGFGRITKVNVRPGRAITLQDLTVGDWPTAPNQQRHADRKVLPVPRDQHGTIVREAQSAVRRYADAGTVYLQRWEDDQYDISFTSSAWNWKTGRVDQTQISCLEFPRVLATLANDDAAYQSNDGGIGLAVPGHRSPWFGAEEDRLTFYDILKDGEPRVDTPKEATVRLLYPGEDSDEVQPDDPAQSFIYYGKGSPCGFISQDGRFLVPEYSPRLYVLPNPLNKTEFRFWSLQLLSMTLLEPIGPTPNHDSTDMSQWTSKRIEVSMVQTAEVGVPVALDSCSVCTVLPTGVLVKIWLFWFEQPIESFPFHRQIWHEHDHRFAKHDILFEFKDFTGRIHVLRCNAEPFLSSPWRTPQRRGWWSQLRDTAVRRDRNGIPQWTLGMNFFWTSMLKLNGSRDRRDTDVTPGRGPFMQVAPQRILQDGKVVAGPTDLVFQNLPPRLQRIAQNDPTLYPD